LYRYTAALMQSGDGFVTAIVGGFSFCAIATSFIGTSIGLSEFAQPRLEKWAVEAQLLPRAVLWHRTLLPRRGAALDGAAAGAAAASTSHSGEVTASSAKRKRGVARAKKLLSRASTYASILTLPVVGAVQVESS
jgi:hypothetical protein